jgi:tetratricopeptide (TPR) repeat protein
VPGGAIGIIAPSEYGRVIGDTQQPESQGDKIELSVTHGHLAFARFPVLIGHYSGDTFAGTESRLDRALNSRLSERRKMGLYPGRIGTTAILLDPNSKPRGAVVVGLGQPADLSIGTLRETLRQGLLAYVTEALDQARGSVDLADPKRPLGLSALLVGAGEGGVDRNSCVQALLQATSQANALLIRLQEPGARLAALEIIELYQDRAFDTWRIAKKAIEGDSVLESIFWSPPGFHSHGGGRRAAPIAKDPNWWQPIQITMPPADGAEGRSLSFAIGGGFARAEARTIAANLDVVSLLLRRAARNIDTDGAPTSPGRILFELLWPDSLKQRSAEEQNRRLILDEDSAAFPWELLDDRRPWTSAEDAGTANSGPLDRPPPAVRSGMVRQLLQARFSEKVVTVGGRPKALVIGDPGAEPAPGFPRLPGAVEEATNIADLLRQTHDVTPLVKAAATPEQIFKQLLGQAWEIVHISAHGVVNYVIPGGGGGPRTGIVLGNGLVMGPAELSKLPVSPSIFFVNCCNLGRVDATDENKARQEAVDGRPELAASIAVQLIQLGVRCVIVAGWEVDDGCARAFGERFYSEMLEGATFGEATLRARRQAYKAKVNDNTWGAFQCYGDPDYRLPRTTAKSKPTDNGADQFVDVSEAIASTEQIRDDVNIGLERDLKVQEEKLVKIEDEARRKNWLDSPLLRAALAEARAELGDLPEAIGHYEAAIAMENAAFKLRAVEQLANLRARLAVREFRDKPETERNPVDAIAVIQRSLRMVEALNEAAGATAERLSLQGGCWKRLGQVQSSSRGADDALVNMAECYDAAGNLPGKDPGYAKLMACNARLCAAVRSGADCGVMADILHGFADSPPSDEDDFWVLIRWGDVRTNLAILETAATQNTDIFKRDIEAIKNAYSRAWRHVGSPVKMRSVTEQLEFYEDIFASGAPQTASRRDDTRAWVRGLKDFIETEFPGVRPG